MTDIQIHTTSAGRRIYCFQVTSFQNLINNIYVISDGDQVLLVDTGSAMGNAGQELLDGFAALQAHEPIAWSDLDAILITHGHIDHFGGLPIVRQHSDAPIGIHALDRRVLSNHEERVVVASRRLENFLEQCGINADYRQTLMSMYLFSKNMYHSVETDFLLDEAEPTVGDIQVFHTPGHCPGQVCLLVDDILLTADHVLSHTTPHQAPESITTHMGLSHYFDALDKIAAVPGVRIGLGGHEAPIDDVLGRVQDIKRAHHIRLEKILDLCDTPKTIAEISKGLFGPRQSYHILLALEEAGAHVEYLYERGELIAANLDEIATTSHPAVKYVKA